MDLRKLKTLIDLVAESGISELEVTEGDDTVKIVNKPTMQAHHTMPSPVLPPEYYLPNFASASSAPQSVPASAVTASNEVIINTENTLTSPMVGTFYRASSPGAAAFVNVGDTVKAGQTLCIIEAMKLLNEIESEKDGVIKQILAENGQPIEYGQALFIIE
jgi:acetyl-CoA carboxylase biotin carboxyl carrier protein